jgi:NAD(P)-dependent dehydrogenase (short-subunit alcohol dehydrogenase family)
MTKYNLSGKVAIVTGASRGLGEQFVRALAESGAHVVLAARTLDKMQKIADEVSRTYGVKAIPVATDVTKEPDVIKMVDIAVKKLGTVDILVNNAGMYVFKPLTEQTLADWNQVMNVCLTSTFLASREVAKVMIPKKSGCMINVTSTFGFGATEFTEVGYYASKGGVIALTKALAVELGKYSIRVNGIAPGFFPTEMSIQAITDKKLRETYIEPRTALFDPKTGGRLMAQNEWIRGAVCFLASDDAKYITGHTLAVDGGWLAY